MGKRLSEEQRKSCEENGYLTGLPPVFDAAGVRGLNNGLSELIR
jgi:hypothetical protein